MPIAKLTGAHIQHLINQKLAAGLAPATVKQIHVVINAAAAQAVDLGALARNPARKLQVPRAAKSKGEERLTLEQFDRLKAVFQESRLGRRWAPLIEFALWTGVRRGEALGLKWQDIDFDAGLAHIRQQLQRSAGELRVLPPKSKSSRREVELSPSILAMLKALRAAQAARRLRLGPRWKDTGAVFTTLDGGWLEPRNCTREFKIILKRAGLPPIRFHALRHSAASFAHDAGADLKDIQSMLGHSSISITADIYCHLSRDSKRAVAARMDALLSGPRNPPLPTSSSGLS